MNTSIAQVNLPTLEQDEPNDRRVYISAQTDPLVYDLPLLFQKREYVIASPYDGKTTDCIRTSNPKDYAPDD